MLFHLCPKSRPRSPQARKSSTLSPRLLLDPSLTNWTKLTRIRIAPPISCSPLCPSRIIIPCLGLACTLNDRCHWRSYECDGIIAGLNELSARFQYYETNQNPRRCLIVVDSRLPRFCRR